MGKPINKGFILKKPGFYIKETIHIISDTRNTLKTSTMGKTNKQGFYLALANLENNYNNLKPDNIIHRIFLLKLIKSRPLAPQLCYWLENQL
jgi:hypothetical protein